MFDIEISGLSKVYKENHALSDINLKIERGSFFGLIGPNGAGKSTIINIISGLAEQTTGIVKINGLETRANWQKCKMYIGTAVQDIMLDPFMKVREYMKYTSGFYGLKVGDDYLDELLHYFDLDKHQHKTTRALSGGMKRRLLIAKSLVHDPQIVILDEPTAGVDIELRYVLWEYIKRLNKRGKTILMTTHYLEEAEQLCNQFAFIKGGRIVFEGNKNEVMSLIDKGRVALKLKNPIPADGLSFLQNDHEIADDSVLVKYSPSNQTPIDILRMFNSSGIEIADISIERVKLDDIFIHLMK